MATATTTIRVERKLKEDLDSLKNSKNESYAEVIRRLVNSCADEDPLSDSEIDQIEQSLKEIKAGKLLFWKQARKELGL